MSDLENMTRRRRQGLVRHLVRAEQRLRRGRPATSIIRKSSPLAEKYYGPLAARPLPARKAQVEPRQEGTRRITVKGPAELPVLIMGYKAPVLRDIEKDSDPYALQMLAAILDGHDAARFNKKLVREDKVALSAGIDYDSTARGPGMLYLHGSPSAGKTVADLEAALRAEIDRVRKDGVSAAELKRAKAQLLASAGLQARLDVRPGHGNRPDRSRRPALPAARPHARQAAAGQRRRRPGGRQEIFRRRCADHRRPRSATAGRPAAPRRLPHPPLMNRAMKRLLERCPRLPRRPVRPRRRRHRTLDDQRR
jgi:hypothetical protein